MEPDELIAQLETDPIPDFLARYVDYQSIVLGRATSTIKDHILTLRLFCKFLRYARKNLKTPDSPRLLSFLRVGDMDISEIVCVSKTEIEQYLLFLQSNCHNTTATVNKKIFSLSGFFEYLDANAKDLGVAFPNGSPSRFLASNSSAQRVQATILSGDQIQTVLNACYGVTAIRDRAFLTLLSTSLISPQEAISLNVGDVSESCVVLKKGRRVLRSVPITPACYDALSMCIDWLTELFGTPEPFDPLFQSSLHNKRMTEPGFRIRLQKIIANAGMSDLDISFSTFQDSLIVAIVTADPSSNPLELLKTLGYKQPEAVAARLGISGTPHPSDPGDILRRAWENSNAQNIG